jgi:O-antigen/teichoic acid export membrane protein
VPRRHLPAVKAPQKVEPEVVPLSVSLSRLMRAGCGVALCSGAAQFLGLVAAGMLSRMLAPQEYGRYALWMVIVMLLAGLFDFEIYQLGVREINRVQDERERAAWARGMVVVELAAGLCAMIALILVIESPLLVELKLGENRPVVFLSVCVLGFHLQRGLLGAFQGLQRFFSYNMCQLMSSGLFAVTLALANLWPTAVRVTDVADAVRLKGATAAVGAIVMAVVMYRVTVESGLHLMILRKHASALVQMSIFPLLSSWLMIINGQADRLILGWFAADAAQVGYYVNGIALSLIVTHFMAAAARVVYPLVASLYARQDYGRLKELVFWYNEVLLLVVVPVCVILSLLAEPLVVAVFGEAFRPAASVFAVWILLTPLFQSMGPRLHLLYVANLMRHGTVGLALGTVTNILLNLWLIPRHGMSGAVTGTGIATGVTVLYVSWVVYRRVLAVPYFSVRNVCFLVVMGLIVVAGRFFANAAMGLGLSLLMVAAGVFIILQQLHSMRSLRMGAFGEL